MTEDGRSIVAPVDVPLHPFARPGNRSGAFGMKSGDRVRYVIDGRTGRADEFLHDGDAFVAWDDGSYGTVKWNNLEPVGADDDHS